MPEQDLTKLSYDELSELWINDTGKLWDSKYFPEMARRWKTMINIEELPDYVQGAINEHSKEKD